MHVFDSILFHLVHRFILDNSNVTASSSASSSESYVPPTKRLKLVDESLGIDSSISILRQIEHCPSSSENTWEWSPFLQDFGPNKIDDMEEQMERLFSAVENHTGKTVNIDGIEIPIVGESSVRRTTLPLPEYYEYGASICVFIRRFRI